MSNGETANESQRAARLPGARAALALLLIINLFNYIDRYVLAAVVPKIREHYFGSSGGADAAGQGSAVAALIEWLEQGFGFTPENALIGSLGMAFMVTYMIVAPLFGWLAERASRWLLVGVGVILWSLASGASGLAAFATFEILFLTRCLVGIGEGAYGPVAPAMISDLYPVKHRGYVLAWFYMAIPVGSALGFVLGGLAAELLGWRWAFYLVVPPGIVLGLWCLFMREPPRGLADLGPSGRTEGLSAAPRALGSPRRRSRVREYLILLRTPSYVLDTLGMAAMTFAVGGIAFWMPDYIHQRQLRQYGQVDLAHINTLFGGIVVVAGLSATLLGGIAGDRLRARYPGSYFLVSGVAMLVGFPLSVAMLYAPFPWAWVVIFLACFCLFFNTGPTNTILANVTHPGMRATGFALNIFLIHALGDVPSPLLIGLISDRFDKSMTVAFLIVSVLILVGGLLWLWGARYLQRDTELAPTRLDSR